VLHIHVSIFLFFLLYKCIHAYRRNDSYCTDERPKKLKKTKPFFMPLFIYIYIIVSHFFPKVYLSGAKKMKKGKRFNIWLCVEKPLPRLKNKTFEQKNHMTYLLFGYPMKYIYIANDIKTQKIRGNSQT